VQIVQDKLDRVSYSSLINWKDCPYYFYLHHILKIAKSPNSVPTIWGKLLHNSLQSFLINKNDLDPIINNLNRTWGKFGRIYKKYIDHDKWDLEGIRESGEIILRNIDDHMVKAFGEGYKVLSSEETLFEDYGDIKFKGFIDMVIETKEGKLVIVDFKTCSSNFMFKKFQDKYKDYQLSLYKNFYIKKHNIKNPKDLETYFVLLERNPKSKKIIEVLRVTSGKKKLENALSFVDKALNNIRKGRHLKNRTHCKKYGGCIYHNTEYCPRR